MNLSLLWLASDMTARPFSARRLPPIVRLHDGVRVAVEAVDGQVAWWVGLSLDDRLLLAFDNHTSAALRGLPVVRRLQPPVSVLN